MPVSLSVENILNIVLNSMVLIGNIRTKLRFSIDRPEAFVTNCEIRLEKRLPQDYREPLEMQVLGGFFL
jgi:hypothetical protein